MHNPSTATFSGSHAGQVNASALGPRVPIYTPEFAANPHGHYQMMRERYGDLVPVEIWPGIRGTLVIGYRTALRILQDPTHFSSDPRRWESTLDDVQRAAPVMGMMKYRPNGLFSDGAAWQRYRDATNAALDQVDLEEVRKAVARIANRLINGFIGRGQVDLLADYAEPLAFEVLCALIGTPPDLGAEVAAASAILFQATDLETVEKVDRSFEATFKALADLKNIEGASDIATRLLHHPAQLTDIEYVSNLLTFFSAGAEIPKNWIANTLYLMMTDARYISTLERQQLSTRTALEEVLHTDPPLANYCVTYPKGPQQIDITHRGRTTPVWLDAHEPLMVSMAACTTSPEILQDGATFVEARHNLGWGMGPHVCPSGAQRAAWQIAQEAIDQLLDAVPDVVANFPDGQQLWRPGPFHRALACLPATFTPAPLIPYVE